MSFDSAIKEAEAKLQEHTGKSISITTDDIPDGEWSEFIEKAGLHSVSMHGTWAFLDRAHGASQQRRIDLWEKRDISKIVVTVEPPTKLDEYETKHTDAKIHWEDGSSTFTVAWCPRVLRFKHRSWFNLTDEIIFGLQLYQLEGTCFYKSDWVSNFEDIDPTSCLPNGTSKFKRWLQFRHWTMIWYETARPGWNHPKSNKPPQLPDGSDFNMNLVLDFPDMDMPSMPSISFPDLPDVEMPSLPDMPSIDPSMPSFDPSMPSFDPSMPSLDASLSMPSMEDRKERPKNRWAPHGIIELRGLKVKNSGSDLILSDATVHHFWQKGDRIDTEKEEHKRFELTVTDSTQAQSWFDSLIESKAEEGDVGGCCTIA